MLPRLPISILLLFCLAAPGFAQDPNLAKEVSELRELVVKLQNRVDQLEKAAAVPAPASPPPIVTAVAVPTATVPAPTPPPPSTASDPLHGTTINFVLDGYYGYNFNRPIGRVNLLRAFDVSSDAISLNQAGVVFENAPDPEHGKRWGGRFDLQFGQATETLQGNSTNEPRPDIYRNIFQAYGTYVFPVNKGLTVDLGKFSSSLGMEGTYTKDQINYSRSLWFSALPFYHMGARVTYQITDAVAFNYWLVNGTQQTEPFNGFKDELFGLTLKPHKTVSWTLNYYLGQEHPDVMYYPTGGAPVNSPTQQGVPFTPIVNPPTGKLHIFDSYVNWQATPNFTLATEFDYVVQRDQTTSAPMHLLGGAAYARYQLPRNFAMGLRGEYLSDRGGIYSGQTQAIKEGTAALEYKLTEGLLLRNEYRRDASNHPFFLTDRLGALKKEQNTLTLGVVWWFGQKQGAW